MVESRIVNKFMIYEDRETSYAVVVACWRSHDIAYGSFILLHFVVVLVKSLLIVTEFGIWDFLTENRNERDL